MSGYVVRCECVIEAGGQQYVYPDLARARQAAAERAVTHNCPCHVLVPGDEARPVATFHVDDRGQPVEVTAGDPRSERGSPPSTYAIMAAVDGEQGAWGRVAKLTAFRAALLLPGLMIWNVLRAPEKRSGLLSLLVGAVLISASISGGLYGFYRLQRRFERRRIVVSPPQPAATAPPAA